MEPRDIMDLIIFGIVAIGLVWAGIRIFQDYSLRNEPPTPESDE